MLNYLVYLVLTLTVALTAGGIFLTTRLRKKFRSDIFSYLLYYLVFIFAFGFYGMWGQVVIKIFLSSSLSGELLLRITGISMLLGLPFLVFAWLMLIQFSVSISGRKRNGWVTAGFLFFNFLIIFFVGWLISESDADTPVSLIRYYFIIMNSLYSILTAVIIWLSLRGKAIIHNYDKKIMAPSLVVIAALQSIPLLFYTGQIWLGLIFIFLFFAGNIFLPAYLNYGTLLSAFTSEQGDKSFSFNDFCKKYEVSPRETDIVREICNGLSNKEISEKLFITLQTVKDHTHRIYIKTNVKSRVQLINRVKEEVKK